eukprot:1829577-Rhodomonas_salina.2
MQLTVWVLCQSFPHRVGGVSIEGGLLVPAISCIHSHSTRTGACGAPENTPHFPKGIVIFWYCFVWHSSVPLSPTPYTLHHYNTVRENGEVREGFLEKGQRYGVSGSSLRAGTEHLLSCPQSLASPGSGREGPQYGT